MGACFGTALLLSVGAVQACTAKKSSLVSGNLGSADVVVVGNLPVGWERDFRPGWCLTRPNWRGAAGKRGIWLLTRDGKRYRAPHFFSGFNEMKDLQN